MSWTLSTTGGTELAKVLNFTPSLDRAKITSRLMGGGYLVQTVGTPTQRPTVNIVVESMDALRAVNAAEAEGALLDVTYRDTTYRGYIMAAPKWTPIIRGRVYSAPLDFGVTEEVSP